MADNIELIAAYYTPNPFNHELGGSQRFLFRVGFTTYLPTEYDMEIELSLWGVSKITQSETFSTSGFTWNATEQRYEKSDYEEIDITAAQFAAAYAGENLASKMMVEYEGSETQSGGGTGSSDKAQVCSGTQFGDCSSIEEIYDECCTNNIIRIETKGCENSIKEIKCTIDDTCIPCGSGIGRENNPYSEVAQKDTKSIFQFPGNMISIPSMREGKLKLRATQLRDGAHDLSLYYSSIAGLEQGFGGWHFSFNNYLLEDPNDGSITTMFNPDMGRMRYVLNDDGTYSPYIEEFEVQLTMDSIAGTASLVWPDGSAIDYAIPTSKNPNIPIIYHIVSRRDYRGKVLVRYEDWYGVYFPERMIDFGGREITGDIVVDGNLATFTFTDWQGREYVYTAYSLGGNFTSIKTPDGNLTEFDYNETDFGGPSLIKYNGESLVTYGKSTSPQDITRIGSVEYPDGTTIEYEYDFTDGIQKKTVNGEYESSYEFDSDGLVEAYTSPQGYVSSVTRDPSSKLITSITEYSCGMKTTEYTYDSNGNILTRTDPLGNVTTLQYNDSNWPDKVTKIIGPSPFNYEMSYTYDSTTGDVLTVTDQLNRTITYTYYSGGTKDRLVHTVNDKMGRTTEFDYDEFGNKIWEKDWQNRYHYYWYDNQGKLDKETDIFGQTTKYTYDFSGNLIIIEDDDGNLTRFEYDSLGKKTKIIDPDGKITTFSYDDTGRQVAVTDSSGGSTLMEYDGYDRVTKITDQSGVSVEYEYDLISSLTKLTDPLNRERTFEYDPETNKLVKMTDPMGRTSLWDCNTACSVMTSTSPDGGETKYYYNAMCQLTQIEYPDGSITVFEYDELGRKVSATGAGYFYGDNVYSGGQEYGDGDYGDIVYGKGDFYYGYNPANTIYYEYDASNRLTRISYPDPAGSVIRKDIDFTYYDNDSIKTVNDAAGYTSTYTYDTYNRISTLLKAGRKITFSYDDAEGGRIDYFLLPNDVKKEYVYDSDNIHIGTKYTKDSGSTVLFRFDYDYDVNGNIIKQTFTDPDEVENIFEYGYDSIDRLVNVRKNRYNNTWYDFDSMGNRLKKIVEGSIDKIENYSYNSDDELLTMNDVIFEYDLRGNLTKKIDPVKGTTEYTFNSDNRLIKVTHPDGTESKYEYDPNGLRTKKTDKTGKTTFYYWNGTKVESIPNAVTWSDEEGKTTMIFFPGVGFKSVNNNNEWRFFITDHLGSVIALTDDSGNVTDRYEYDEYGNLTSKSGNSYNPYRYIGQEWDEDTGLYYLRARYYDPATGRFVSRDPIGVKFNFNYYSFGKMNPLLYIDLSGLQFSLPGACVGFGVLGAQNVPTVTISIPFPSAQNPLTFSVMTRIVYGKGYAVCIGYVKPCPLTLILTLYDYKNYPRQQATCYHPSFHGGRSLTCIVTDFRYNQRRELTTLIITGQYAPSRIYGRVQRVI